MSTTAVQPPVKKNLNVNMTTAEIAELASVDPVQAQIIMDLQDRLTKRKTEESKATQEASASLMMLQAHQRAMANEKATQDACELHQHRRPDGSMAICGQRIGDGSYFLICCKCSKNFYGVGDGPNQLSRGLANFIDFQQMGG